MQQLMREMEAWRRSMIKSAQMQKQALSDTASAAIGVGVGGLLGGGIGYGLGKKDSKLLSTLIGAGLGASAGGLGGYGLNKYLTASAPKLDLLDEAAKVNFSNLLPNSSLKTDGTVIRGGKPIGAYTVGEGLRIFKLPGNSSKRYDGTVISGGKVVGTYVEGKGYRPLKSPVPIADYDKKHTSK